MEEGIFLDFARAADAGARMTYGRGEFPPREAVQAMADLVEARVLVPIRKREGGAFLFMVERGTAPLCRANRPRRGHTRKRTIRKSSLTMVLAMLTQAARRGEPCPTNEELAAACRLSGKLAASYRMRRLVADGKIAVDDRSPWGRRVVTILTGPHAGAQTVEAAL